MATTYGSIGLRLPGGLQSLRPVNRYQPGGGLRPNLRLTRTAA